MTRHLFCQRPAARYALAAAGALLTYVYAEAPVQPVHAQPPSVFDASRLQTFYTGLANSPNLRTITSHWSFELGPTTCLHGGSEYKVMIDGPRVDEDGQPIGGTATIGFYLEYHQLIENDPPLAIVRFWCKWCNGEKTLDAGFYESGGRVQLQYDPVNKRWGAFYIHPSGTWAQAFSITETGLGLGSLARVGGQTDDANSELGPFPHRAVLVKPQSTLIWGKFTPTQTDPQVDHDYDSINNRTFITEYVSSDGSLNPFTAGVSTCP